MRMKVRPTEKLWKRSSQECQKSPGSSDTGAMAWWCIESRFFRNTTKKEDKSYFLKVIWCSSMENGCFIKQTFLIVDVSGTRCCFWSSSFFARFIITFDPLPGMCPKWLVSQKSLRDCFLESKCESVKGSLREGPEGTLSIGNLVRIADLRSKRSAIRGASWKRQVFSAVFWSLLCVQRKRFSDFFQPSQKLIYRVTDVWLQLVALDCEARQRKDANRRKHSKPGTMDHVPMKYPGSERD